MLWAKASLRDQWSLHSFLAPVRSTHLRRWQGSRLRVNRISSRPHRRRRRHSGRRYPSNLPLCRRSSSRRSHNIFRIRSLTRLRRPQARCLNRRHRLFQLPRHLFPSQDHHFSRLKARSSNSLCSSNQTRRLSSHSHLSMEMCSRVGALLQGIPSPVG
jgi:hypothetical protein